MNRRAGKAAPLPPALARSTSSSRARHFVPSSLSLLIILVASFHTAACETRVEEKSSTLSLSSQTSLLESTHPTRTTPLPPSRRLLIEHHGTTSGSSREVVATEGDAHAHASWPLLFEKVQLSLPKAASTAYRLTTSSAPTGSPTRRRAPRRKLTQPLHPTHFNISQIAKLLASDSAASDWFGWSMALDGDTMVIGAWNDDADGLNTKISRSGSVYVFTRDVAGSLTASWTQRAKLIASDSTTLSTFGWSMAISGDTIVVGAVYDDDKGSGSGSAYIFTRDVAGSLTAGFTQRAKLLASDGAGGASFGYSVAIEGNVVAVGARGDDKGSLCGSAYIFTRDVAETPLIASWTQRIKLLASDGSAGDQFGVSVAVSGDTVAVGAANDDDMGSSSGSAYIFTCDVARSLTAGWTQRAKLLASDGAAGNSFGVVMAVSGDTVVMGAYYNGPKGLLGGSAYVFTRDVAGKLTSSWTQRAKLLASDGVVPDSLAVSVAISGDIVAVGTRYDGDKGFLGGAVYIFRRDVAGTLTASWTQCVKLLASDGAAGDSFGVSVAVSGETVAVGAVYDGDNRSNLGSVYVFALALVPSPPLFPRSFSQITSKLLVSGAR